MFKENDVVKIVLLDKKGVVVEIMQGVSQDLYKVDVGNAEIVCKADELEKIREIPKLEDLQDGTII